MTQTDEDRKNDNIFGNMLQLLSEIVSICMREKSYALDANSLEQN